MFTIFLARQKKPQEKVNVTRREFSQIVVYAFKAVQWKHLQIHKLKLCRNCTIIVFISKKLVQAQLL